MAMRITDKMNTDQFLSNLQYNMYKQNMYSNQVSTNRKFLNIADDPIGTMKTLTARQQLSVYKRYQSNVSNAKVWSDTADTALRTINTAITDIYELTVEAANGTNNPTDGKNIGENINSLIDHIIDIGNTAVGGQYIFSGYSTTKPPFTRDETTGKVLYNGLDLSDSSITDIGMNSPKWFDGKLADGSQVQGWISTTKGSVPYQAGNSATVEGTLLKADGTSVTLAEQTITSTRNSSETQPEYSEWKYWEGSSNDTPPTLTDFKGFVLVTNGSIPQTTGATGTVSMSYIAGDTGEAGTVSDISLTADSMSNAGKYYNEANQHITFETSFMQNMQVSVNGVELAGSGDKNIFTALDKVVTLLNNDADKSEVSAAIEGLLNAQEYMLTNVVQVGGQTAKLKTLENRYSQDVLTATEIKSQIEDVDQAEAIMNMKMAEVIYKQALAAGSRILQTSLADFLN